MNCELPSRQFIEEEFRLFRENSCNPEIDFSTGIIKCFCQKCIRWKLFLEGRLLAISPFVHYEVFTKEYIEGLASYLLDRASFFSLPVLRVLEVGAGNGRFSFNLQKSIAKQILLFKKPFAVEIIATDIVNTTQKYDSKALKKRKIAEKQTSGNQCTERQNAEKNSETFYLHKNEVRAYQKTNSEFSEQFQNVVRIQDAESAIRELLPDLVIACWMPLGVDWSACMRTTSSVKEYILIGETDRGICGHPRHTWGCLIHDDDDDDDDDDDNNDNDDDDDNDNDNDNDDDDDSVEDADSVEDTDSYTDQNINADCNDTTIASNYEYDDEDNDEKNVQHHDLQMNGKEDDCNLIDLLLVNTASKSKDVVKRLIIPREIWSMFDFSCGLDDRLGSKEAWERLDLVWLSQSQVCRTDEIWMIHSRSRTISFRKLIF